MSVYSLPERRNRKEIVELIRMDKEVSLGERLNERGYVIDEVGLGPSSLRNPVHSTSRGRG